MNIMNNKQSKTVGQKGRPIFNGVKRAIIISVIVGLFCLTSAYAQTSAQGGEGGKSGAGQGGKGGDGTVIINNKPEPPAKEDVKVDTERIKQLIKDLDADDIAVRDKATEELKAIGKPAFPYLEESARSDSPEVAWRSKVIINAIKKSEQQKEPQDDSASRKIGPTLKQFGNSFSIIINGATPGTKSFSMSQDGSGKIAVKITEYDKDGKEQTKTYEANNAEEFKQKYPEIAREYGIGEKPSVEMDIPDFDFDDIFKDFGKSWDKRLEEEMNRLRNMFNRQGRPSPKAPEIEDEGELPGQAPALSATDLGVSIGEADDPPVPTPSGRQAGNLTVNNVEPNGLGSRMGLKTGDVIISVNGTTVDNLWQCRRQIKSALAKGRVTLVVTRENKKETLVYPK
ncbi:MAG: PDZ domain-containing protein [Planctomycetota bacterium]